MNIHISRFIILFLAAVSIQSCVPNRKFTDVERKARECEEELKSLQAQVQGLETASTEFGSNMEVAQRKINALQSDTAVMGSSLRILRQQYDKINALNNQLLDKSASINEGTRQEKENLMTELALARNNLQKKEDALGQLEKSLNEKQAELADREQKLEELKSMMARKDSTMKALRNSVADALLGFEGKGLTVENRNGRVYVSMEAKLLFGTGSTEVDQKGKQALIDLARAVQGRTDLNITVEGHTDSDEFSRTTYPRNNWDLSVLRATSVIKIMMDNSEVDPTILTAAGRSKYQPVDPSDKARNRRIEVILSPKLDELLQIISAQDE